MAGAATMGSGASHSPLHLLASAFSIATCLFVIAQLGPFQHYVGSRLQIASGGSQPAAATRTGAAGAAGDEVPQPPGSYSLEHCLKVATEGHWRRLPIQ